MSSAGAVAFDFDNVVPTVQRAHSRATREDAEDAVQTAVMQLLEKDVPLTARAVVGVAKRRVIDTFRRRERGNSSLDAALESSEESAPRELAVATVDFDAHLAIREMSDNPVLRRRMEALDAGYAPTLKPLGEEAWNTIYPMETVAQGHALLAEGLTPTEVAKRLGATPQVVERWRRTRKPINRPGWSREFAVEAVKAWAAEEGRPPLVDDFRRDPRLPCTSTLHHLNLTKTEICRLAGLEVPDPPPLPPKWSLDALLDAHEDFFERHGRWPKWSDRKPGNGLPGVKATTRLVGTTSPARILELIEERSDA